MEILDNSAYELVEVFSKYITRKGVRIYRKDGRPWHFWVKKKKEA